MIYSKTKISSGEGVMERLRIRLNEILGENRARIDEDMREHTSFKAGGRADFYLTPQNIEELISVIRALNAAGTAFFILGNGTNVLVRDGGYRGAVIRIGPDFDGGAALQMTGAGGTRIITASAGMSLAAVAKKVAESGFSGLEALSGIPGNVGGALYMNAGAYGVEIADIVEKVAIYDINNDNIVTVNSSDMEFAYRESVFKRNPWVILSAVLRLRKGDRTAILRATEEYARERNRKQPMEFPSAGSFFKRPAGAYAGKLIEDAGLKGLTVGGARVSEKHAGFIVNIGGATAADILALAGEVKRRVSERDGFDLEPEPRIIGEN
ncbi:MAG: UDP-N-acetylmuramate dehydrogenase [Clostridiales Family XIII bacterium]|nr:UDP-N-acetylmuramate dehydrogenase [Clostridiales Family XIII bacterium]